jgi:hypothetical protein
MNLLEFSSSLSQQDSRLTAYISRYSTWSPSSEIILAREPEDGVIPSSLANSDMEYFLEVSIAKEVVKNWESQLSQNELDSVSRANLLIYYAENDAYPTKGFITGE